MIHSQLILGLSLATTMFAGGAFGYYIGAEAMRQHRAMTKDNRKEYENAYRAFRHSIRAFKVTEPVRPDPGQWNITEHDARFIRATVDREFPRL